jgi:hypothetical protein
LLALLALLAELVILIELGEGLALLFEFAWTAAALALFSMVI